MRPLYEQYRPRAWSEVVGQAAAVEKVRAIGRHGFGGNALWITGGTGTGKTTIARLIASEVASPHAIEEMDAGQLTPAKLGRLAERWRLFAMGKGGHVLILNEAHGLRRETIRALLVEMEPLRSHVVVIFTTTVDGQAKLWESAIDAGPLLGRCLRISLARRDLAKPFAKRCREIATAEGLNGKPMAAYVRLAQLHRNSLRAMIQSVAEGEMKG